MIEIILESFSDLFKGLDAFLKTRDLTIGAILAGVAPFILIWIKISKEKEKRSRSQRVEKRQLEIENRQLRIESKIDDLMLDRGVVSSWSIQEIGSTHTVQKSSKPWLTIFMKVIQKIKSLYPRRKKTMKDYVKKLGRTKLQVYIVFTIVNIFTLFATLSGVVDVNTAMQPYMPFIDLGAQLAAGWIYTHYQGKVDVVTAQNGGIPNVDTKPTGDSGAAV